jgi:hypothetical protein
VTDPARPNDRTPTDLARLDQGAARLRDALDARGVCTGDPDQLMAYATGLALAVDTLADAGAQGLLELVDLSKHLVESLAASRGPETQEGGGPAR